MLKTILVMMLGKNYHVSLAEGRKPYVILKDIILHMICAVNVGLCFKHRDHLLIHLNYFIVTQYLQNIGQRYSFRQWQKKDVKKYFSQEQNA